MAKGNYCNVASDCLIHSSAPLPGCACYVLLNKDFDLLRANEISEEIKKRYVSPDNKCPISSCMPCKVPEQVDVDCVVNRCVVMSG